MRIVPALLVFLVLGASCGRAEEAGGTRIDHPEAPDELVVRMETFGGLMVPGLGDRQIPALSIYGDGSLVQPGPEIAIYPPPALPSVVRRDLTEDGLQRILAEARSAGLVGPDQRHELEGIADAPWTRFVIVAEGERHVTEVYALGLSGRQTPEPGAREQLSRFAGRLQALEEWLPEGSVGDDRQYEADSWRVMVRPAATVPSAPDVDPGTASWPLQTPPEELGEALPEPGVRCAVVSGDDRDRLLEAAAQTTSLTRWQGGGREVVLGLHPLLPDETGC